jgi:hypothetical protein
MADPDDVLTPEQSALVKKAESEMRQGKFVTLAELRNELDRPHPQQRGKQTDRLPHPVRVLTGQYCS